MTQTHKVELPYCYSCSACDWHGSSFRATCPACRGTRIAKRTTAGGGSIVDIVPVLFPPENLKKLGQYASVLVKFDENFQMFGIIPEKFDRVAIGDRVRVSKYDETTKELFFNID
jgi:uncharacterized OB-fold protein